MPSFWTVLKWAVAICLAPVVVYLVLAAFVAAIVVGGAVCSAPVKQPTPAVKQHRK